MKSSLEKQVWSWLLNTLSTPRPEFNGYAPCPYIKKYRDRIHVLEVESGVKIPIEHAVSLLRPLNYAAIVLAFPKKPPIGTINSIVEEILNQPQNDNIEILINNHRLKGAVRGVYTGFKHCDLIIIQHKDMLKWARINLKKGGYYNTD